MAHASDVEAIEVRLVLEAIYARYGFDLRGYCPESIRRRVLAAQEKANVQNLGELSHRLLTDPGVFATVLSSLTVQVTEMFRDPSFYATFRREVVPLLRTYPKLKIWAAGCASGEEAYSLAILLIEEELHDRVEIYGTDLDGAAIAKAQAAVYPEVQARQSAENYQRAGGRRSFDAYCTRAYGHMTLSEEVRRKVCFFQHDLATDGPFGEMHVIFCRNVALYFDAPLRERVHGVFLEGLVPGGFLCLGASEALPRGAQANFEEMSALDRIFRRRAQA